MTSELTPVLRALGLLCRPRVGEQFIHGNYRGVDVIAAVTHMGMDAAQQRTESLFALHETKIDHLFVVGIAGAMATGVAIGQVLVPASVVDARDGIARVPVNLGNQTPSGTLYSSDQLHYDDAFVKQLNELEVALVDMESGAIAAVCDRHNCPFTVIRAVSDRIDAHAQNFDVFHLANADGSPRYFAALRYVLARPSRIGYLMAMARGSRKAIAAATAELLRDIDRLLLDDCG